MLTLRLFSGNNCGHILPGNIKNLEPYIGGGFQEIPDQQGPVRTVR